MSLGRRVFNTKAGFRRRSRPSECLMQLPMRQLRLPPEGMGILMATPSLFVAFLAAFLAAALEIQTKLFLKQQQQEWVERLKAVQPENLYQERTKCIQIGEWKGRLTGEQEDKAFAGCPSRPSSLYLG